MLTEQPGFQESLDEELNRVDERVHKFSSVVCERAAALRYKLDRVNKVMCDAFATDATPGIPEGTPIEVKSCHYWHENGDEYGAVGRIAINSYSSHRELLDQDGWYAVVVYDWTENADGDAVIILAIDLVPAEEVNRFLTPNNGTHQKVRWDLLIDPEDHAVDVQALREAAETDHDPDPIHEEDPIDDTRHEILTYIRDRDAPGTDVDPIPIEEVIEWFDGPRETAAHAIDRLKMRGEIYEPRDGAVRSV